MLYRVFVAGIVAFWLLMAALLVRTELFPARAERLPVPVDYVSGLIFRHEQPSDLILFGQNRRIDGNFHLQPKRLPASADGRTAAGNLLSLSGNFLSSLPGAAGQRAVFHGGLELDERNQPRRVELSLSLHEQLPPGSHAPKPNPPGVTLHLDGRPVENRWQYEIAQGNLTLQEGSGSPEELIDQLGLRGYGLDSHLLSQATARSAATTLTAHRGVLRVNSEDVETFVLTIHQGEGMDTEVHVNQLGQVLAVKTFLGYDFYDETLAP